MLTAYDATFAAVADAAGVECMLVGDSLGMVCQGLHSTVGVTLDTMAYHTASVARGLHRAQATAWVIADLPYGSYAESREQLRSACGADAGRRPHGQARRRRLDRAHGAFLVERGVPVCAHLGLTPQTVHALGGYRVQGKTSRPRHPAPPRPGAAGRRRRHAGAGDGARAALGRADQELPHCHTIGIGAGNGTAGQVLVLHDMLGVNLGKMAKFVHNFMQDAAACAPWRPTCRPSRRQLPRQLHAW
jgi:3-methyl-2-oxobutanoate hydroxymethyltransferase